MAIERRDRRTEVTPWNPVTELEQMTNRLTRLLDETRGFGWPTARGVEAFLPPADLEETEDSYVVDVELPGVDRKDVDVELVGRRLTVTGERKERERTGVLRRRTRTVGRFFYEIVLPGEVDDADIKARLADGVLTVTIPKAATEREQRRHITVD